MSQYRTLGALSLVIALSIGLSAAWPFYQSAGLPDKTDAELHVYRIAELGYSLTEGNPYPRWAPDFYHGHGYPIFNYYAPLTYHLGNWLTFLHPERAASGARLVFVLSLVVGATGAYLLGALYGGSGGGLLGSLAYTTAPYILLINPHLRGDLPECLALALLPWVLWAWECLWRRGAAVHVVVAVLVTGAAFLSHNLTGLTAVVLIAGLSLWRWLVKGEGPRLPRAVLAAALFVLLTAFFWLPFLAERQYIQLDVAGDGHYDFRNHFVSLQNLLAPLASVDRRATAPDVPMTTGLVSVALAVAGTLRAWRLRRLGDVGFFVLTGAGLLWLVTSGSRPVWEAIPPLAYYQFPWRFLGPLAVLIVPPVAMLGVGPVCVERRGQLSTAGLVLVAGAATAAMVVSALLALSVARWEPGFGFISKVDIIEAELTGRWRGTTSTNDFVPTSVEMIPGPMETVLASYSRPPVDRVNRQTLPDGAAVTVVPDRPWVNRLAVATPQAFRLRLFLFDFPGWKAYVDGVRAPIEVAHPEGFITVAVPAGEHEVVVRFASTPVQNVSWILSGFGAAALIAVAVRLRRRGSSELNQGTTVEPVAASPRSESATTLAVGSVFACVVLAAAATANPLDLFGYTSPRDTPLPADVRQHATYGNDVALLAFDLARSQVLPGDKLEVTLYWIAERPIEATYQSFVHLVYPEGHILVQSDHLNPGGTPTDVWPIDRYIVDRHRLTVPADAVLGQYLVSVGLYTLDTEQRVPVVSASCGHRPDAVVLCRALTVGR